MSIVNIDLNDINLDNPENEKKEIEPIFTE